MTVLKEGRVVALTACPGVDGDGNPGRFSGLYELVGYRGTEYLGTVKRSWGAVPVGTPEGQTAEAEVSLDPHALFSQVDPAVYGEMKALEFRMKAEMAYREAVLTDQRCECRERYGPDGDGTFPALAVCPRARACAERFGPPSLPERLARIVEEDRGILDRLAAEPDLPEPAA